MKKEILKMVKDLLLLFTIIFIIDFLFGQISTFILYNSPDGRYYKSVYSLEKSSEDILIIGSSKAETNFIPRIFNEKLNMSCWNAGRGGQKLHFFRIIQEATLKRYAPKIVILNLRKDILEGSFVSPRVGLLKPFYWKHSEIRPLMHELSTYEKYFIYSNLYAYNSTFYYLLRSYFFRGLDGKIENNGWKPRKGEMHVKPSSIYNKKVVKKINPINDRSKMELETLLSAFVNSGTKVYIIISPDLMPSNKTSSIPELNKLAEKFNIKIFNYSNDTAFLYKPELFYDFAHLNTVGAKIISIKIADQIIVDQQNIERVKLLTSFPK